MTLSVGSLRSNIGKLLGVAAERKEELYIDLARGSTLFDLVYWLQILFSAGIATLGLVMNSPAVIIGAMLISPLMGPILAAGLALASGDLILGARSMAKIALSCLLAVAFSVILVITLPFREMTSEIAARTEPNTLDLIIALFSGAVGSIAVCRDVKGVATSIPGVAIAVALMPPLCVVGYGLGLMIAFDASSGWRVSSGGGLLFLTNLVAITFTAMVVFLSVKLSTAGVRAKAEEWEHEDPESAFVLRLFERFPRLATAREVRSLPVRFTLILVPFVAIFIPLAQAFGRLQAEVARQRKENVIRREVLDLWQDRFQLSENGKSRSTVDNVTVSEKDGTLKVDMRLFDDNPYSLAEKRQFITLLGSRLGRAPGSISLELTEIPTASVISSLRDLEKEPEPPSVSDLQSALTTRVDAAIASLELPSDARIVNREIVLNGSGKWKLNLAYICSQPLDGSAEQTVADELRTRLNEDGTSVQLQRIPTDLGLIEFPPGDSSIPVLGILQLDYVGRMMRENSALTLSVSLRLRDRENLSLREQRSGALTDYLESRWNIDASRIRLAEDSEQSTGTALFRFGIGEPPSTEPTDAPANAVKPESAP